MLNIVDRVTDFLVQLIYERKSESELVKDLENLERKLWGWAAAGCNKSANIIIWAERAAYCGKQEDTCWVTFSL